MTSFVCWLFNLPSTTFFSKRLVWSMSSMDSSIRLATDVFWWRVSTVASWASPRSPLSGPSNTEACRVGWTNSMSSLRYGRIGLGPSSFMRRWNARRKTVVSRWTWRLKRVIRARRICICGKVLRRMLVRGLCACCVEFVLGFPKRQTRFAGSNTRIRTSSTFEARTFDTLERPAKRSFRGFSCHNLPRVWPPVIRRNSRRGRRRKRWSTPLRRR